MGYIGTKPTDAPLTSSQLDDGIVTAAKLATDSVETAKVKDVNVTAGKLAATQDLSTKTITLPASVAGLGTGITNAQLAGSIDVTSKITGVVPAANLGSGTASASTYLAGNQTYQTITEYDDNVVQSNIAMLGFKVATNGSLVKYNLVDQAVDDYQDASGVDATASTNEVRSGSNFYYGASGTNPTGGTTGTYSHGGTNYAFNKFTADTNLVTTDGGSADIFLIAGGGGGHNDNGGGGGSGGMIWKANHTFAASTTFAVDIGAGGAGRTSGSAPLVGEDSTFASTTFVAKGGGFGGQAGTDGSAGGSGGGAGRNYGGGSSPGASTQSSQSGDSGTYGFGFAGGAAYTVAAGPGGGGGGTGAVGGAATSGVRGDGGVGKSNFVNSSATETTAFLLGLTAGTDSSNVATVGGSTGTLYIGGGGGGNTQSTYGDAGGVGGLGGGADSPDSGTATVGNNGLVNTGGGGAAGNSNASDGDGGSGLLIVRYTDTAFSAIDDMTLQSTDTTAEAQPTYGEFVTLIENASGTATLNTDIKGYVSRDSGTTFTQGTLVDEGTWGTNKKILGFHDLDISSQPSGVAMCYKITTHNQVASSLETRVYASSIGWR